MHLAEFKKLHSEECAAIHDEGVAAERDRVTAHLTLGSKFGDMPTALAAIKDGSGLTFAVSQKYIESATSKLEQRERQMDSDEAGAILDGAAPASDAGQDLGDQVADRICGKVRTS